MPRSKRIEYPGACYHAMSRGNNGQEIFKTDDGRRLFLATLGEACEQTGWKVHAFVLMSNHYHLLLETPEANLVDGMKWFQGAYTQRFNSMFRQRGHLFQGRYKAIPVQTSPRAGGLIYYRQVSSYIHLNPYRAHLCGEGCSDPLESYLWSSYPDYIGSARKRPKWLTRNKVLRSWGLSKRSKEFPESYRALLERKMKFENDPKAGYQGDFERQIKRGWYLGSEEYREDLLKELGTDLTRDTVRGEQRRDHSQQTAEEYLEAACVMLNISEEELRQMKANRIEKQAVAWLLKSTTTVSGVWLSERLGLGHPSNHSRAMRRFRESDEKEVEEWKKKMTKCKG